MSEIVLTRIDDRLIHGQVMTAWVRYAGGNRIVIVDDIVAQDVFLRSVLEMAVPSGIKLNIYNIEDAAKALNNEQDSTDKIIILVKTPNTVYELVERGVDIKDLNVGGMGARAGRKKFYKNISVSEEEKESFRKLIEKGTNISIRIIPDNKKVSVEKFL